MQFLDENKFLQWAILQPWPFFYTMPLCINAQNASLRCFVAAEGLAAETKTANSVEWPAQGLTIGLGIGSGMIGGIYK